MNKYNIHVVLTDGREVKANVVAENQDKAIERLMNTDKFKEFINDTNDPNVDVKSMDIKPLPYEEPQFKKERYVLQKSEEKEDWWVCTDTKNLFLVMFLQGHFNETSYVKQINNLPLDALQTAKLLREMGEWLALNHKDLI